jgi:hypothetical protein
MELLPVRRRGKGERGDEGKLWEAIRNRIQ